MKKNIILRKQYFLLLLVSRDNALASQATQRESKDDPRTLEVQELEWEWKVFVPWCEQNNINWPATRESAAPILRKGSTRAHSLHCSGNFSFLHSNSSCLNYLLFFTRLHERRSNQSNHDSRSRTSSINRASRRSDFSDIIFPGNWRFESVTD